MGTFRYPIKIGRLDDSAFETVEALADTGATYTWIPRPVLERLGIPTADPRELQLADGSVIERDIGFALATVEGRTVPTVCVFGDPDSLVLLGDDSQHGESMKIEDLTSNPQRHIMPTDVSHWHVMRKPYNRSSTDQRLA
jgi:predicted aspartyl protease